MLAGELFIKIRGDHSGLKNDLNMLPSKAGGTIGKVGLSLGSMIGLPLVGKLVSVVIDGILKAASTAASLLMNSIGGLVGAASYAEELGSKFGFVFGSQASETNKALDDMATRIRRGRLELKDMASSFGSLLGPAGLDDKKMSDMSVKLTGLASDLASFYNTSDKQATTALFSGLVGESEPLRRYGVQLSAARIEQEALRSGLARTAATMTPAAKMQAIYNIILKDTAQAQGDAERTGGSFANSFRNLQGIFKDITAQLGQIFLPSATLLVNTFSELFLGVRDGTSDLSAFGEGMAKSLKKGIDWFKSLFVSIDGTQTKLGEFMTGIKDFLGGFFANFDLAWRWLKTGAQMTLLAMFDMFVFVFKNIGSYIYDQLKMWAENFAKFREVIFDVMTGKKSFGEAMGDAMMDRINKANDLSKKWAEEFRKNGRSPELIMMEEEMARIREEMRQESDKQKANPKDPYANESERPPAQPPMTKGVHVAQSGIAEYYDKIQNAMSQYNTQVAIKDATEKTNDLLTEQNGLLMTMNGNQVKRPGGLLA